jgi:hypothetical protein
MNRSGNWVQAGLLASALSIGLAGCGREDAGVAALRARYVLNAAPSGATTIAEAKAGVGKRPAVVFTGQVGAGRHETFEAGKAAFLVSEIVPNDHRHGASHDADSCPFCKRKAAQAAVAAVQFLDPSGQVVPVDARKLFGIKPGDTVVVRGRGELVAELDLFRVTADGIYVAESGP